jgi:type II secretory pathway component PulL
MLLDVAFLNGTVSELTVVRLALKELFGKARWSSSNNQSSGTVV